MTAHSPAPRRAWAKAADEIPASSGSYCIRWWYRVGRHKPDEWTERAESQPAPAPEGPGATG
ncbi:hypothetical protein I546_2505 [Mycobacterium kansasii 732]|nr:hypothetical protein I546_2505 [Mycobacterium kansasii 732]